VDDVLRERWGRDTQLGCMRALKLALIAMSMVGLMLAKKDVGCRVDVGKRRKGVAHWQERCDSLRCRYIVGVTALAFSFYSFSCKAFTHLSLRRLGFILSSEAETAY
jgi:hypothetical protein